MRRNEHKSSYEQVVLHEPWATRRSSSEPEFRLDRQVKRTSIKFIIRNYMILENSVDF